MKKFYSGNTAVIIIALIVILFACKKIIQSESGDGNISVPGSENGSVQGVTSELNNPSVSYSIAFGGTGEDNIYYVIKLSDGNYLSCGFTESHNGDFDALNGGADAFLMKTDNTGNIIWKNTYGGSRDEVFYNIIETATGDIIAAGASGSNDRQVSNHHGAPGTDDIWLVKTNSSGQLIKERCYGGSQSESTFDLGQWNGLTIDNNGNILFVGETNSTDGDLALSTIHIHGDYDGWVVKLDPVTWNIIKSTTIGDAAYDAAYCIHELNGYYFVTGTKSTIAYSSPNVDVHPYFKGFAAKLDASTLDIIWYKKYGGSGDDDCNSSVISQDGKLVLTGHANSTDGDCVGNNGNFNTWTWKINPSDGSIIWNNFTGVAGDTAATFNLIATQDGGFVAMGGVLERFNPFLMDAYVVKIDANGFTQWTKRFGGSGNDQILGGIEKNNGSLLLGGLTSSYDGDVTGFHGGPITMQKFRRFPAGRRSGPKSDAWLVELNENSFAQ